MRRAEYVVTAQRRIIGRDGRYDRPMYRTPLGPWQFVAGHWFRLVLDQWPFENSRGVRRWLCGP